MITTIIEGKELLKDNKIKIDLGGCPRCGRKHKNILAHKFSNEVEVNGTLFEYWTMCPVKEEPVLLNDIYIDYSLFAC